MIRIVREGTYSDRLIAYEIFIDGNYCGKIKANEMKEFPVENGSHTVYAKARRFGSNTLHVHVDNSIVNLEVGNAIVGWRFLAWPHLYQVIWKDWKDRYLFLKEWGASAARKAETQHDPNKREIWTFCYLYATILRDKYLSLRHKKDNS